MRDELSLSVKSESDVSGSLNDGLQKLMDCIEFENA